MSNLRHPDRAATESTGPVGPIRPEGLEGVFQVLWRRKWIVAACTLAGVLIAGGYLLTCPSQYDSTSMLYLEDGTRRIIEDGPQPNRPRNWLPTQVELLQSAAVLGEALDVEKVRELDPFPEATSRVEALKDSLTVQPGDGHDISSVAWRPRNPEYAAVLANAVVNAYIAYQTGQSRSTTSAALNILRREKRHRDEELAQRMKALVDFKTANGTLSFEQDGSNIVVRRLAQLSEMLTKAEMELVDARVNWELVQDAAEDPERLRHMMDVQRARSAKWPMAGFQDEASLRIELHRAERKVREMAEYYQPSHPAYKAAEREAKAIGKELDAVEKRLAEAYTTLAREKYTQAKERMAEMSASYAAQQKKAMDLNAKAGQFALLEAGVRRAEKLCDILDARIKEVTLTNEDTTAIRYSIVERAQPAVHPSYPQPLRIGLIGLLAGAIAGLGLALMLDWTDARFRDAEEVTTRLGAAVLGGVPRLAGATGTVTRGQHVALEPASAEAEAFRNIRTAIYFGTRRGQFKTLLVTSPTPGDGKSVLVGNLALAMAQNGMKTLVIDADLHRPTQHEIFRLSNEAGLSDIELVDDPAKLIQSTAEENLFVLPAGPSAQLASELLGGETFEQALATFGETFDRIVIDSPPVVPLSDARILSAICDRTVMVLRADRTPRKVAEFARELLHTVGANLLGVVLNCLPRQKGAYGYYYEYDAYRKYTEGDAQPARKHRTGRSRAKAHAGRRAE